jgi:hypothetical protein
MFSCDAPGCSYEVFQQAGRNAEPVEGIRGQVSEIDSLGGRGDNFFACSREHVAPAIEAVLDA